MSRLSAVVIVFALALVALGIYGITREKGSEETSAAPATSSAAPVAPAPVEPTPEAAAGVELTTAQVALGTVVTSGGDTLYRFDKDTPKPPKSNCAGACAQTWPPVLSTGGTPRLTGLDPALVGTVARDDGAQQVTLNGWPLYTFAKDEPGQTKGEGVGGTWHAIAPNGKPAAAATGGPATVQRPAPRRPQPSSR
jgi:predicted lipoprotein with Yx(FWY)xxD motif